jgi:cytochrome c oxidase subunit 2
MEVNVIASQWSWRFEYVDQGFSSTELVLPKNQQVLLVLSSTDVIHSFWVPEFRLKQDALPGENMERELRITPSELGEFQVRCAELCGLQHAYMNALVRVVERIDFDTWVEGQTAEPSGSAAERGKRVAQQFGCLSCHSTDGSQGAGPTWLGVFGSEETMTDGTTVTVNEEYLRQSILDPGAQIVEGYQNIMPANVSDQMSTEQINDIIAFIKSLAE